MSEKMEREDGLEVHKRIQSLLKKTEEYKPCLEPPFTIILFKDQGAYEIKQKKTFFAPVDGYIHFPFDLHRSITKKTIGIRKVSNES